MYLFSSRCESMRGQINRHVGVIHLHDLDAFRGRDQGDESDLLQSPFLEDVHRGRGRTAGRQHRIDDVADVDVRVRRQLVVIGDRLVRLWSR